ncbi:hypothetical protein LEP1GSC038_4296 [Leptospira weilii str. 2006001855]|uniref:Uncharacterized protein n=2 Tax=Leptospira weilii TaxID=28184 RepID=M6FZ26_9LEPT|nr:hypothetical protein LEP1GSC038_4296 [Leptospira weilii str. 2006001855]
MFKLQRRHFLPMVKILIGATLASFCIYIIYCVYKAGIVTALLAAPQPIVRNELLDLNHSLWKKQRWNEEIPIVESEKPPSYSNVFSVQPERYLCAAPTGENISTGQYDKTEVCFLRLSAEDVNWIRQKFANVQPGELLDRNDEWKQSWNQVGLGRPVLHNNPLEEMFDDAEEEHMATGVIFLKWVTLRFLINQVNPNDLIHYSERGTSFLVSSKTKKGLYFIPYNPTIPNQTPESPSYLLFARKETKYYIPLQGNFLFRTTTEYGNSM